MMGETESARAALQHALQINPELPEKDLAAQRLAILSTDDPQGGPELQATLEKAVTEHKDDPVARTRLSAILLKSGELDRAQSTLKAALAINPLNVGASLGLIQVHLARHETSQALDLAKTIRKQAPDDPSVSHQLGRIAFQTGEYQWAASLMQESSRKLPDDLDVLFDRATAAYSIGRVTEAEEIMRRILRVKPLFSHAGEISFYLEMMALANDPTPAGSVKIDQALQTDPACVPALMAFGATAEKQSNAAGAKQAYEKALAKYPDFIPAKRNLALLAATAAESDPKAYDLALQTREAFPSDPAVAEALGILTYRKGDFSRAASLLKESIGRLGEDARRTYYLGLAQYHLNDNAAALTLKRSLELGLKDEAAADARQVLSGIK
jgi:tetratricopeptide (TPR) repeat protein